MATPRSVCTVMAHPDDAELWVGGTLAQYVAAGATVTVIVPHYDATRDAEAVESSDILGVALYQYDEIAPAALHQLLITLRPEVVITHPLADVHPDHRRVATVLLEALPNVVIATGCPKRVYACDSYNSLTFDGPVPAHTVIDVTDTFPVKMRALAAHASQPITEHFGPMAETLGRLWGARIGTQYGENFVPLPVLGRLPAAASL